jgi:hypothetical protein
MPAFVTFCPDGGLFRVLVRVQTSAGQTTSRFSKFSIREVVEHGVDGFLVHPAT